MADRTKATIDEMTQEQMARLWRYAPAGHPYFLRGTPVAVYFAKQFEAKGGFTPSVSKGIDAMKGKGDG